MVNKRLGDRVIQLEEICSVHGMPLYAGSVKVSEMPSIAGGSRESGDGLDNTAGFRGRRPSGAETAVRKIMSFGGD